MSTFYDLIIAIGLIATVAPAAILLWHTYKDTDSWEAVHPILTRWLAALLSIVALVLAYGSFIEPRLLITNEETIDITGVEEPFTVAFVADFQVGPYKRTAHVQKIVDRILLLDPDYVFIGGDQVNNADMNTDETQYLKPLAQLTKQIPTYAIHGNHEYGVGGGKALTDPNRRVGNVSVDVKTAMEALGVQYLVNEAIVVSSSQHSNFYLFGGDSFWYDHYLDFSSLEMRSSSTTATIALIHNPAAAWEASTQDINLMLSGHTHGGQIRLPFLGPLGRVDDVIPADWYQGRAQVTDDMQLYVTSGTGESGPRARLFNPPEVVLLTIE